MTPHSPMKISTNIAIKIEHVDEMEDTKMGKHRPAPA